MPYAQPSDVQALAPHVPIDARSTPNSGQVMDWIRDLSAFVDIVVEGLGFTIPVTAPRSLAVLRELVATGVMAKVMRSRPNPEQDPKQFQDRFDSMLKSLKDPADPLTLPDAGRGDLNIKTPSNPIRSNIGRYDGVDDDAPVGQITRGTIF